MSLKIMVQLNISKSRHAGNLAEVDPVTYIGEVNFDNYDDLRSHILNGDFLILNVQNAKGNIPVNIRCSYIVTFIEIDNMPSDLLSDVYSDVYNDITIKKDHADRCKQVFFNPNLRFTGKHPNLGALYGGRQMGKSLVGFYGYQREAIQKILDENDSIDDLPRHAWHTVLEDTEIDGVELQAGDTILIAEQLDSYVTPQEADRMVEGFVVDPPDKVEKDIEHAARWFAFDWARDKQHGAIEDE